MSKRNWPSPCPWTIVEHQYDGSLWIVADNGDWIAQILEKRLHKYEGNTFPTKSEARQNALRIIKQ